MVTDQVKNYLERINYRGPTEPSATTLRQLHLAHLHSVPFENLSIHYDQPIVLAEQALYDKIVNRRRGGFCFEMNGAFAMLLRELGFQVRKLAAQVKVENGYTSPFDHMLLLVELEERWIADVGFGRSFIEPLRLVENDEQTDVTGTYRLARQGRYWHYLELGSDGQFQPRYRFTLQPYEFADYEAQCHFHQTDPSSHFKQSRMATLATETGRITLSDLRFITTTFDGERHEVVLADEQAFEHCLQLQFGLRVT